MSADASGPYDETIRLLAKLRPPRPIRMNIKAKFIGIALLLGPGVLLLIPNKERQDLNMGGLVIFCIVLDVVLGVFIWLRPCVSHKHLIAEGEMAIGRINGVWGSPRLGYPDVRYEFETLVGERLTKTRQANRIGFYPGMKVPVFYARENPKRHVALCTAFYELASPEEQ